MNEIKTKDRFDKLTNLDISTHHRNDEYCFMKSDFLGAFAYWVVVQSPYKTLNITEPLVAFSNYVDSLFDDDLPKMFTYDSLGITISEDQLATIPEVLTLNEPKVSSGNGYNNRHSEPHPDFDFIDLGALARNIFYMMLRKYITQS